MILGGRHKCMTPNTVNSYYDDYFKYFLSLYISITICW